MTLVNVLSVVVLVSHRGRSVRPRDLLVSVATNPLIVACVGAGLKLRHLGASRWR